MRLSALSIACPHCGSTDVVYSCNPACCFNHVCGRCYTTFETATTFTGEFAAELGALPVESDTPGAAAPCARCGEHRLYAIEGEGAGTGRVVCAACRALLVLELTQVSPG